MKTIEPTYVTFEQAKWLKEKGFDIENIAAYYIISKMYGEAKESPKLIIDTEHYKRTQTNIVSLDWNKFEDKFSAPEQWQVVEWLRVNHGIWVRINPTIIEYNNSSDTIEWCFNIFNVKTYLKNGKVWGSDDNGIYTNNYYYNSPQKAYSEAFDYILKELI